MQQKHLRGTKKPGFEGTSSLPGFSVVLMMGVLRVYAFGRGYCSFSAAAGAAFSTAGISLASSLASSAKRLIFIVLVLAN